MNKDNQPDSTPQGGTSDGTAAVAEAETPERELTTSERLFPDLMHEEEPVPTDGVDQTIKEENPKDGDPEPEQTEFMDLDKFGEMKFKAEIGGEEKVVSFKDLVKGYQTDQYLSKKGQTLAEKERELRIKEEVASQIASTQRMDEVTPESDFNEDDPVMKELSELKSVVSKLAPVVGQIQYQKDIEELDKTFSDQGIDGFKAFVPKIEEYIMTLSVEEQANARSFDFYSSQFQKYKIKELTELANNPKKDTVLTPEVRPKPNVATLESPSTVPTGVDIDQTKNKAALERLRETGDVTEILALKGYG